MRIHRTHITRLLKSDRKLDMIKNTIRILTLVQFLMFDCFLALMNYRSFRNFKNTAIEKKIRTTYYLHE